MTNTQTEVDEYAKAFAELTVPSLRARAAAAGIAGRSKMNKTDLVWALAKFEAAQAVEIDSAIEQVRGLAVPAQLCLLEHGYVKPCQQSRGHVGECDKETVGLVRATGAIPAELCDHGIDASRPRLCSICREDATLGPVEETDGRCPYGNTHAIETCLGCGTEDEQGNQVTSVDDLGRRVQATAGGHLISFPMPTEDAPDTGTAEQPVPLNTWLEEGIVLVDPRSVRGQRYRFDRWTRFGAKLINMDTGGVRVVLQSAVVRWSYLPKMSAAGIERAKIDNRPRIGDIVKFHAGDARERTVITVHATDPSLVLLNDSGNVWVVMAHLRVVRRAAKNKTLICAKSFYSNGERGICGVQQIPGPRGLHEGPHFDDHRRLWSDYTLPGDRRPLCGVEMPALPGMSTFTGPTRICRLILNADGECPDVNHKPVSPPVGSGSINAELIRDRVAAEQKLHELRYRLSHLAGAWQSDPSSRIYGLALKSVLVEDR